MLICKVIGHVWATKKEDSLEGVKFMVVRETGTPRKEPQVMVAADKVGAGIGEDVLVVSAIVGIIDTVEVEKESDLLEPPRPRRGRE